MPPYLTPKPKVIRTPNVECGSMFIKIFYKKWFRVFLQKMEGQSTAGVHCTIANDYSFSTDSWFVSIQVEKASTTNTVKTGSIPGQVKPKTIISIHSFLA